MVILTLLLKYPTFPKLKLQYVNKGNAMSNESLDNNGSGYTSEKAIEEATDMFIDQFANLLLQTWIAQKEAERKKTEESISQIQH